MKLKAGESTEPNYTTMITAAAGSAGGFWVFRTEEDDAGVELGTQMLDANGQWGKWQASGWRPTMGVPLTATCIGVIPYPPPTTGGVTWPTSLTTSGLATTLFVTTGSGSA